MSLLERVFSTIFTHSVGDGESGVVWLAVVDFESLGFGEWDSITPHPLDSWGWLALDIYRPRQVSAGLDGDVLHGFAVNSWLN